jgi:hypothetical protein
VSRQPHVYALTTGDEPNLRGDLHGNAPVARLTALAHALAASPAWASLPGEAALVVRRGPQPALALVGRFGDAAEKQMAALRGQVSASLERLRYVSYAQAEADSGALATRLRERFGQDALRRFHFAGIPRGGLIVLGMLSYALGLKPEQLHAPPAPDAPLVVVDDCALSGARFRQFLEKHPSRRVVFAPLYAHPDLRSAVEEEPRVEACLSARNLHDHAPERLGDDYADWRARWQNRPGLARYWIGQPDHVCFPWNEPDVGVWNPETEQAERAWRIVPPEHCLKNRFVPDEDRLPVHVQPEGSGPLAPADHVLFGELTDGTVVASTETNDCFHLAGTAAAMWRALVEHGALEPARAALQHTYDVDEDALRDDLHAFADDLRANDLLEHRAHADVPTP